MRNYLGILPIKKPAASAPKRNPVGDFWELYDKIKQEKTAAGAAQDPKFNLPSDFNLPTSNTANSTSTSTQKVAESRAKQNPPSPQKVVLKESNKKTEKK